MEESGIKSKGASIDTSLITEANCMDIRHIGTYLIPLESWEGAEHCPIDGIGIGCLVVEESGVESESAKRVNSMNIHRTGIFLIPLCSWEAAEQCPGDKIGIGHLAVKQSRFEYCDRQELAVFPWHFKFLF